MVTVTLHSDRPAAAIRRWRKTFSDTRWCRVRGRRVPVVRGQVRELGPQQRQMLAFAEAHGGSVTPLEVT